MKRDFEMQYMNQPFNPGPAQDLFVAAWVAYHMAADRIDGNLPLHDRSLNGVAIRAGFSAMDLVLRFAGMRRPTWDDKLFQNAKLEALRIVERHLKSLKKGYDVNG
jgi:hypothetical protein